VAARDRAFATVFVGPDRQPAITEQPACTNHQETVAWPEFAARSRTVERRACLIERLADPAMSLDALAAGMLQPPLYAVDPSRGFATVYTAVYRPVEGAVDYIWPGKRWRQSFDRFETPISTLLRIRRPRPLARSRRPSQRYLKGDGAGGGQGS
jgi:predicted choloylglycine hydrolase